jgi:hypothetical protein
VSGGKSPLLNDLYNTIVKVGVHIHNDIIGPCILYIVMWPWLYKIGYEPVVGRSSRICNLVKINTRYYSMNMDIHVNGPAGQGRAQMRKIQILNMKDIFQFLV